MTIKEKEMLAPEAPEEIKFSDDFYKDRPSGELLEKKRDEYIAVAIEKVLNNEDSKLEKLVSLYTSSEEYGRLQNLDSVFAQIVDLVQQYILEDFEKAGMLSDEKNKLEFYKEFSKEKITEQLNMGIFKEGIGETIERIVKKYK